MQPNQEKQIGNVMIKFTEYGYFRVYMKGIDATDTGLSYKATVLPDGRIFIEAWDAIFETWESVAEHMETTIGATLASFAALDDAK